VSNEEKKQFCHPIASDFVTKSRHVFGSHVSTDVVSGQGQSALFRRGKQRHSHVRGSDCLCRSWACVVTDGTLLNKLERMRQEVVVA